MCAFQMTCGPIFSKCSFYRACSYKHGRDTHPVTGTATQSAWRALHNRKARDARIFKRRVRPGGPWAWTREGTGKSWGRVPAPSAVGWRKEGKKPRAEVAEEHRVERTRRAQRTRRIKWPESRRRYVPDQFGLRFSRNEARPSRKSAVERMRAFSSMAMASWRSISSSA